MFVSFFSFPFVWLSAFLIRFCVLPALFRVGKECFFFVASALFVFLFCSFFDIDFFFCNVLGCTLLIVSMGLFFTRSLLPHLVLIGTESVCRTRLAIYSAHYCDVLIDSFFSFLFFFWYLYLYPFLFISFFCCFVVVFTIFVIFFFFFGFGLLMYIHVFTIVIVYLSLCIDYWLSVILFMLIFVSICLFIFFSFFLNVIYSSSIFCYF